MIRNIVFDMGMVLLTYDPMEACMRHARGNRELAAKLCNAIFFHPEWGPYIDGGLTTDLGYMERVEKRLTDPAEQALAADILSDWHLDGTYPRMEMRPVVQDLLERGFRLYLLSNVGYSFDAFKYKMPYLDRFSGIMLSCQEKLTKPDMAIYRRLCDKFGLEAEECLFIDDVQANIDGAEAAGLHGYCYADGDVLRLKAAFAALPKPE